MKKNVANTIIALLTLMALTLGAALWLSGCKAHENPKLRPPVIKIKK